MLTLMETAVTPLQITWYALVVVLWLGYFFLEGFDYGVAMLLPILGKTEEKRRVMINTVGPLWDGNEVWLLTAGGATFAAFPGWYATLFSGLYLPLFLILLGLILRGVAFEYRGKKDDASWRSMFDWFAIIGSFLPSLVLGVGFANFVKGVPLGKDQLLDPSQYWSGTAFLSQLWGLFTPFTLLGGVLLVALFLTHGAIFLSLKTDGKIRIEARAFAQIAGLVTTVLLALFVVWQNLAYSAATNQFLNGSLITWLVGILSVVTLLGAVYMTKASREGWALIMAGLSIVTLFLGIFVKMYGNLGFVQNSENPLNISTAAASGPTLGLMTIAAVIFVPIVLGYQGWSYWVFAKRISTKHIPPATKDPVSV